MKSNITVRHHPILFTRESVKLVVTDSSNTYLNERDETQSNEAQPEGVSAIIMVTLVGVEDSRIMDQREIEIFSSSLLQFYQNHLNF